MLPEKRHNIAQHIARIPMTQPLILFPLNIKFKMSKQLCSLLPVF